MVPCPKGYPCQGLSLMSSLPPPSAPETHPPVVQQAEAGSAPGERAQTSSSPRGGGPARTRRRAARPWRWLGWAGLASIVVVGLSWLAIRDFVWPNLDRWRPAIERRLADSIGRPVRIGELVTGLDGIRPRLIARDVAIDDGQGRSAFAATEIRAVLSLRSLLTGRPALALLEIDAPSVRVERLGARRLRIAGIDLDLDAPNGGDALGRLFAHRRVGLRHATVDWEDRVVGESATLRDVDISLGSVGRRHRASLRAAQVLDVGVGIDAAIEFYRPPFTSIDDRRRWHGEAYVSAERVELAALARRWNDWRGDRADPSSAKPALQAPGAPPVAIGAGRASARAWSRFEAGHPFDTLVKFAADGVEAAVDGRRLPVRAVSAEAHAERQADGTTAVAFRKLRVGDDRGLLLSALDDESRLVLAGDGRVVAARLSLGRFDTAGLTELAGRLPLSDAWRSRLAPLRVDGVVNRLAFDWAADPDDGRGAGDPAPRLAVDLAFEQLSFQRVEAPPRPGELKLPGFTNLSGTARLTERGGTADLNGESVVLRFPGLFAEPDVPLDRLDARASWTIGPAPAPGAAPMVDVTVDTFRFANADASGAVSGRYRSGGRGAGIVDLRGHLDRADAARTARYLPLGIPDKVRRWVRDAVLAGRSGDAQFVL